MGQPGHPLISHLGISNIWYTPTTSTKGDLFTFNITQLLRSVVPLFFKFSIIRIFNLFYPLLFKYILTLRSLPHSMTLKTYYKYYRSKAIIDARTKVKYDYMLRVGYPKLTVSETLILKSSSSLLIFFSFQNYMKLVRDILNLTATKSKLKNINELDFGAYTVLSLLSNKF